MEVEDHSFYSKLVYFERTFERGFSLHTDENLLTLSLYALAVFEHRFFLLAHLQIKIGLVIRADDKVINVNVCPFKLK